MKSLLVIHSSLSITGWFPTQHAGVIYHYCTVYRTYIFKIKGGLNFLFSASLAFSNFPFVCIPQNFTVALDASMLGQLFIFQTIFQLWALHPDILTT